MTFWVWLVIGVVLGVAAFMVYMVGYKMFRYDNESNRDRHDRLHQSSEYERMHDDE